MFPMQTDYCPTRQVAVNIKSEAKNKQVRKYRCSLCGNIWVSLNVFTGFAEFSDKKYYIFKNVIWTYHLLCKRPRCYHSVSKTQVAEFDEFTEFLIHLLKTPLFPFFFFSIMRYYFKEVSFFQMSGRFGLHFTPKHMFNLKTSNIYFSWLSNHIWKLEGMLPKICQCTCGVWSVMKTWHFTTQDATVHFQWTDWHQFWTSVIRQIFLQFDLRSKIYWSYIFFRSKNHTSVFSSFINKNS